MKRRQDPRHLKRLKVIQDLFAYSFTEKPSRKEDIAEILSHKDKIDQLIAQAAPAFPIQKIAKVDVAILRNAVYEMIFEKKEPPKVIIDEAVELAKELGGEGSPAFVNGVLGTLLKTV